MNVRLIKRFQFQSVLVSERYLDAMVVNNYSATVHMTTVSDMAAEQNKAYERIRYWMSMMQDCVLIDQSNKMIDTWQKTGARIMAFPDDPVDQLVGMMLYSKLSTILQGRIDVNEVLISSAMDDDIIYRQSEHESLGPFAESGWWNDPRPIWETSRKKSGKVISLQRMAEWSDLELDWDDDDSDDNVVVVADFPKDENK